MSNSVPSVYPISLKDLGRIISTMNTCIGSPFTSLSSCSQPLVTTPKARSLSIAEDKLGDVIRSMNETDGDVIAITKENIDKLKYIARTCTCSDHRLLSNEFAYYWLASSRLARFLNHMSWTVDAIKWKCLASGDPSCTSVLDCFSSTKLHDTVRGLLNRIAIGQDSYKSLNKLARHWFCRKHQEDSNTFQETLKNLRQQCRVYWSSIGRHRRSTKKPDPRAGDDIFNDRAEPSHHGTSVNASLISDSSDIISSTANSTPDWTNAPAQTLQSYMRPDSGKVTGNPLPWNDPRIYEDGGEYDSQGDSHPLAVEGASSPRAQTTSLSSTTQTSSDTGLSYRLPGSFHGRPMRRAQLPVLVDLQSQRLHRHRRSVQQHHRSLPDRPRPQAIDVFNKTLNLIREPIPQPGNIDHGNIYVFKAMGSLNLVKVGRTTRTIQERAKEVRHCVNNMIQVKNEYNICRVPQHKRLEKIILKSLESQQCKITCSQHKSNDCDKRMDHQEFFKGDANEIADLVELFRQWIWSDPSRYKYVLGLQELSQ
ncbi:MAG: hypothetical protein Q9216_000816 [Gyalolechia sp. 2 TL-2023]